LHGYCGSAPLLTPQLYQIESDIETFEQLTGKVIQRDNPSVVIDEIEDIERSS
jgi:hypothetical protein